MTTHTEIIRWNSPIGMVEIQLLGERIQRCLFPGERATPLRPKSAAGTAVEEAIQGYFTEGKALDTAACDLSQLSGFSRQILEATARIPFGATETYGSLAEKAGRKGAARAVGQALARNPLALFIPCHRVNSRTGLLTGFAWGVERKDWLQKMEAHQRIKSAAP